MIGPILSTAFAFFYLQKDISQEVLFMLLGIFVGCGLTYNLMSKWPLFVVCAATLIQLTDNEHVRFVVSKLYFYLRSLNKGRFDSIEDTIEQCKAVAMKVIVDILCVSSSSSSSSSSASQQQSQQQQRNSASSTLTPNERRSVAYRNLLLFCEGLLVWCAYDVTAFWLWQFSARLTMAMVCILIDLVLVNDMSEMRVKNSGLSLFRISIFFKTKIVIFNINRIY